MSISVSEKKMILFIIHQISLLARDLSKRITWSNMPKLIFQREYHKCTSSIRKNYLTIRLVLQIGKHEFSAPWKLSSPKFQQCRNKATHSRNKHHSRAFKQFCHIRWWKGDEMGKGIHMGKFLTSSKHKPHGTNLRACNITSNTVEWKSKTDAWWVVWDCFLPQKQAVKLWEEYKGKCWLKIQPFWRAIAFLFPFYNYKTATQVGWNSK